MLTKKKLVSHLRFTAINEHEPAHALNKQLESSKCDWNLE